MFIRRRTEFLLRRSRQEAHKLEGKIFAVCDIDEVIKLIRSSRTREDAIAGLQKRAFRIPPDHEHAAQVPKKLLDLSQEGDGVFLTHVQAEAIGSLRLIQLVGLEIEELAAELRKLHDEIKEYESILESDERVRQIIRDDCEQISEKFGDDRRTQIEDGDADDLEIEALIQEHDVVVTISHEGYVKRLPVDTYRSQGRGGTGIRGSQTKEGDFVEHVFVSTTHTDLLCFTNTGRVFRMKVWQIPEMSRISRGRPIQNLIELRSSETARFFLPIADFEKSEDYLFFATASGKVKRTALKDYRNVNRSGIIAINLNEGDRLVGVVQTNGDSHVLLATSSGMAIRFNEDDARVMGRAAAGVKGNRDRLERPARRAGPLRCRR